MAQGGKTMCSALGITVEVLPVMSQLLPRGVSGSSCGGEQGEEGCPRATWLCSLKSAETQRPS